MMATALRIPDGGQAADIEARTFKAALRILSGARDRSATYAPLQQVRVTATHGGLTLASQNLRAIIRVAVPADATGALDILIPWDTAVSLANLPGRLTLSDGAASGAATLQWVSLPIRDWPTAPEIHADAALGSPAAVIVDAAQLAADLRLLAVAVARDESRPVLRGVRVEAGKRGTLLIGTDGTRLTRTCLGPTGLPDHVVGQAGLEALSTALGTRPTGDVAWRAGDTWNAWTWGAVTVAAEHLTGRYPDYIRVLPDEYPAAVTLDRDAWAAAMKPIVALARRDRAGSIVVQWGPGGLTLRADAMDVGTAQTSVAGKGGPGQPVEARFDPRLLADVPKGFGPGPITVAWSGRETPMAATQGDRLHIVLPLRDMV